MKVSIDAPKPAPLNTAGMVSLPGNVKDYTMCVDPGITGTGIAIFPDLTRKWKSVRRPTRAFLLPLPDEQHKIDWILKAEWYADMFEQAIRVVSVISTCYIEMPVLWDSGRSHAAASQGDLFKLSYLVGEYANVLRRTWFLRPNLLSPGEWKGQLPKKVVSQRIHRALGRVYGNHIDDAVGMGLYLQGWTTKKFWTKVKEGKVK